MLSFGDADRLACSVAISSCFFFGVISLRFCLCLHLSRKDTENTEFSHYCWAKLALLVICARELPKCLCCCRQIC